LYNRYYNLLIMILVIILLLRLSIVIGLREHRAWSTRTECQKAEYANYPFAYAKYSNQSFESKGRVNSNMQDFRHECQLKGGRSKCNICEDIICTSEQKFDVNGNYTNACSLQLQGVATSDMSQNIPIVSDTAWAVNGKHRRDYGGNSTTHFCVMLTGGNCIKPYNQDFAPCSVRCFGYGFGKAPVNATQASDRSIVDIYPGHGRWTQDGLVDLWQYPRNCTEISNQGFSPACNNNGPKFGDIESPGPSDYNPQGFTFTLSGNGEAGFTGINENVKNENAKFRLPEDVARDERGAIYVADTGNHAIRMIHNGTTTTLAGKGYGASGYTDGDCSVATFLRPRGLDVKISDDSSGTSRVVILIADTGNHRIRQLEYYYQSNDKKCSVKCLAGLCGNNTLSETDFQSKSWPISGFADGHGDTAKFSAPEGVAFLDNDYIAVADTGNFLIRLLDASGETWTLAGGIADGLTVAGKPLGGCPPPCLVGVQGYADGSLEDARFYNPRDVTRGVNNSVYVADEHRIRILELPQELQLVTTIQTIRSSGRVSTLAGSYTKHQNGADTTYLMQGQDDGRGDESTFFQPSGVFVDDDGMAYTVDAASCRIRRITPMERVAESITCTTVPHQIVRPSGCTSFDQNMDKIGRKISRVERNIQYNYGTPYEIDLDRGKYIKNCVGVPPPDKLDKIYLFDKRNALNGVLPPEILNDAILYPNITGDNLVIDDSLDLINEDSEQGMAIIVECPSGCSSTTAKLEGTKWYSDSSSICLAALHDGKITDAGGFVQITLQRRAYIWDENYGKNNFDRGSIGKLNLQSTNISFTEQRIFSLEKYNISMSMVHHVGGTPSAPLEGGCGYRDAQPSNIALFNKPSGIVGAPKINDTAFLYVADTDNHRIRGLSATCTQICENGGRCVEADTCQCQTGWTGVDCTTPVCTTSCGTSKVCTGPEQCTCRPGWEGANCDIPQCIQNCLNGAACTAPDTCTCASGWFDVNCTTPVCSQTCANGGQCIGPNRCKCPENWSGPDCRIPVCEQTCKNGGFCVAPNTCACPPQYINYDCSNPVCNQGMFKANPSKSEPQNLYSSQLNLKWEIYKPCNLDDWCVATNEFECVEKDREMKYDVIKVPSGGTVEDPYLNRRVTGRKTDPTRCMEIELPTTYKINAFELLKGDGTTTGFRRYAPNTPYDNVITNAWRGYEYETENRTGPWTYNEDRQIARVDWLNMTQGHYVCANNGNCTEPDTCACADGWMGFDCRTPICTQGYYEPEQKTYISGLETNNEVEIFFKLDLVTTQDGYNSYNLTWPYSNPKYKIQWESYANESNTIREFKEHGNDTYLGPADWSKGFMINTTQGGYRCSIRSVTEWENRDYVFVHPNFFSKHMDKKAGYGEDDNKHYTYWQNMQWPPLHKKSRVLEKTYDGYTNHKGVEYPDTAPGSITYQYTKNGWRRNGIWSADSATGWAHGVCILQFNRTCTTKSKQFDLESSQYNVYTQDTDIAYRPRVRYDDYKVTAIGRWDTAGGECVDHVVRGCFNNGTCILPNVCMCDTGWTGSNCTIPKCKNPCLHNGNCTFPDVCTCERGWEGADCSIPICAQECQNRGTCVAPDTCKCNQFPSEFRDNRVDQIGGKPLFQKLNQYGVPNSEPLDTGWTGYDCSVPICVQAEQFLMNIDTSVSTGTELGGRGGNDLLDCTLNGVEQPRCPQFDREVTSTKAVSFQTGCGYDPVETGCCVDLADNRMKCYYCPDSHKIYESDSTGQVALYCNNDNILSFEGDSSDTVSFSTGGPWNWLDSRGNYKYCGKYHAPRRYETGDPQQLKYGEAVYFVPRNPSRRYTWSSYNDLSTYTSNKFLCGVTQWEQGDYIDDAGYGSIEGVGSVYGLSAGRQIRINHPPKIGRSDNTIVSMSSGGSSNSSSAVVTSGYGTAVPGEGIYACAGGGSCLGPDKCSCKDGYRGYDCKTPMCRHLRLDNSVSSCTNGGICESRDKCDCVMVESVLWTKHIDAPRGTTGWSGSDCSIPMCTQGHYDPFCTDLPQAPAGQGCYRCANGGNCTAPDVCTCAQGWEGYDCKTPVCEIFADPLTRKQLGTVSEDKLMAFEKRPCDVDPIYGVHGWKGRKYTRGNCTLPNTCTCLCMERYNVKACHKKQLQCDGPWQDIALYWARNVLINRGPQYVFGSRDCASGYEGNTDHMDRFTTCHLSIYVPSQMERDSVIYVSVFTIIGFFVVLTYYFIQRRLQRKYLLAQIERRRSKRSSEESLLQTA